MKRQYPVYLLIILLFLSVTFFNHPALSRELNANDALDEKVRSFLESKRWWAQNVPYADGRLLYDIIIKNNYTRALEMGTSTGHSSAWIAWALSKTGGKLITIEIDESRYRAALKNFKKAGVEGLIDARLAKCAQLGQECKG